MNWGYKILTVIILFVTGISGMVFIAMRQTNEMIDDDYYTKEMHFQEQIDAVKNLRSAGGQLEVIDSAGVIKLMIPVAAAGNIRDGHIEFIRPSDQRRDRSMLLATDDKGVQLIPKSDHFIRGNYRVRVRWNNNNTPYYTEQSLYIN